MKRQSCEIAVLAIVLGAGVLIGGLLPSCVVVWLLGGALIAFGVFALRA